jgi:hypothetical protein
MFNWEAGWNRKSNAKASLPVQDGQSTGVIG